MYLDYVRCSKIQVLLRPTLFISSFFEDSTPFNCIINSVTDTQTYRHERNITYILNGIYSKVTMNQATHGK